MVYLSSLPMATLMPPPSQSTPQPKPRFALALVGAEVTAAAAGVVGAALVAERHAETKVLFERVVIPKRIPTCTSSFIDVTF